MVVPRLIGQLEEQLFLTHEAATWTVETWTLALYPTWSKDGKFSGARFTPEPANQHIPERHRTQSTNRGIPVVEPVKAQKPYTPPKPQHILGRHRTQPTNPHRSFPVVESTKGQDQSTLQHYVDSGQHRANQELTEAEKVVNGVLAPLSYPTTHLRRVRDSNNKWFVEFNFLDGSSVYMAAADEHGNTHTSDFIPPVKYRA